MAENKRVLTIQDLSCYGKCSLTIALPVISACGVETAVIPSAVLSTHTAFPGNTFRDLTEDIPKIAAHWRSEGIGFDCIYTGYLADPAQIETVKEASGVLLNAGGLRIVDPAMADNGRLYRGLDEAHVKAMAAFCEGADILLPNLTEACLLTGTEYRPGEAGEGYVRDILSALAGLGAKNIVLKGAPGSGAEIVIAIYGNGEIRYHRHKKLPRSSHGTGDCFAAALTGAVARGLGLYDAVVLAADFVTAALEATPEDSGRNGLRFEPALPLLYERLK
ncbi:MAG: pyridoxamine kinase [Firmicutes bacterium]|nr:pyridoxamine kinase [Bacillota bacterium]